MTNKGKISNVTEGKSGRMNTRLASKIPRSQAVSQAERGKNGSTSNAGRSQPEPERNDSEEVSIILELIELELKQPFHPVQVGKLLTEEGFHSSLEILKLGKFRFRIVTNNPNALKKLKLDKYNLRLWEPKIKDHVMCVVKGVPENLKEQEVKQNIEADTEIIKVERMKTRNNQRELVDTNNLKVTFKGTRIPEIVKIYGCCFRCEMYVFPIRQCEKCWRFGHGTKFCTNKQVKCKNCGGDDCKNGCTGNTKSVNCRKEHSANDKNCPERKRRQLILKEMKTQKISYVEAEECHPKLTNRFSLLDEEVFPSLEDSATMNRNRTLSTRHNRSKSADSVQRKDRRTSKDSYTSRQPNRETQCKCAENALKATDIERFIHQLRRDLIAEIRARTWLKPLIDLQAKIIQGVQMAKTDLDKDRIIIEIGNDLKYLIDANSHQYPCESRITPACKSGV